MSSAKVVLTLQLYLRQCVEVFVCVQIEGAAKDLKGDIKGRFKDAKGEAKGRILKMRMNCC